MYISKKKLYSFYCKDLLVIQALEDFNSIYKIIKINIHKYIILFLCK
jgi:hypothetical protein